jgi:hypothetical protein
MSNKPETLSVEEVKYIREDLIEKQSFSYPKEGESKLLAVGQKRYIRTVTHHYIGVIVELTDKEIVLDKACWVAHSGRWTNTLLDSSNLKEVEPYPDNTFPVVQRGAMCDYFFWNHELPRDQK